MPGCSCNGLHMLQPNDIIVEKLRDQSSKRKRNGTHCSNNKRGIVEVYWQSKRSNQRLQLAVRNTDNEPGSMIASLPGMLSSSLQLCTTLHSIRLRCLLPALDNPSYSQPHNFLASVEPQRVTGDRSSFEMGCLQRRNLMFDCTPYLPLSLGQNVYFTTLALTVPARSTVAVCSAVADADDTALHPGFVYMAGVKHEHESPLDFSGEVLAFPLREAALCTQVIHVQIADTLAFLIICAQAFGGCGHHRGLYMHHSADFVASEGTDLLCVCDGVVVGVNDSKTLGAPHVDLLPEANFVQVKSSSGFVAQILHIQTGTATVQVGDTVRRGQVLGRVGNVGFSTGAHVHVQVNKGVGDCDASVMWALHDDCCGAVVPVAGHTFGPSGWVNVT